MHQLTPPTFSRQRGFTLIESIVALVVAALGILGVVGIQMRTLTDTQTSVRRAQAVRLIEDLGERLTTNPNALEALGSYASGFASNPPPVPGACESAACDRAALATRDIAVWKESVREALPLGQANLFIAPGESGAADNRRLLGVMVAWRENERDTSGAYKDDIDATKVRAKDGSLSDGTNAANACPPDFTCHLQYIPVIARCAPYFPGGAIKLFYCPGP